MKQVNLQQGTPAWLVHRRSYYNASEAAAMLGLDKNVKRTELLRMKKTGTDKEFSDFVQKHILDKGHEVEAMARPIIEEMIGQELYPVTGTDGKMSASFDGLTMMEETCFEHKQWNADLADQVNQHIVPDSHMPQLQQQLMISGANEAIFVVSDGTKEKMAYTTVTPDEKWFERIRKGWEQFEADLADFEVTPEKQEAVANTIESLPSPSLSVSASVDASNLPVVADAAKQFIANIKTDLQTDQDFADAEATVKFCKDAEKKLDNAKDSALSQTSDLDQALRTIDDIKAQLRDKRLMLDKLVKSEKQSRKEAIIAEARTSWAEHIQKLTERAGIAVQFAPEPDFSGAMKGKKLLASMQDAVDTALANAKIDASSEADRIAANVRIFEKKAGDHRLLFPDLKGVIAHPADALEGIIASRIDQHKQKVEQEKQAEQKRIMAEEKARPSEPPVEQPATTPESSREQEAEQPNTPISEFDWWWQHEGHLIKQGNNETTQAFAYRVAKKAFESAIHTEQNAA